MNLFLRFIFRFGLATFVAGAVSVITFMALVVFTSIIVPIIPDGSANVKAINIAGWFICIAVVGFAGVFSGTFLLQRTNRRYGSILLLGMGLDFYIWLCSTTIGSSEVLCPMLCGVSEIKPSSPSVIVRLVRRVLLRREIILTTVKKAKTATKNPNATASRKKKTITSTAMSASFGSDWKMMNESSANVIP